jgi:hypothetical protein
MLRAGVPLLLLAALMAGCPMGTPTTAASATPTPVPSVMPTFHTNLPSPQASYAPIAPLKKAGTDAPPWPAPSDTASHIHEAKLDIMATEAFQYHVHSHLDVYVNGQKVEVPGLIGIDPQGTFISPLHTHSGDGVLHIEAPAKAVITLGQALTEWGVSPEGFTAYVNGAKQDDVAGIALADHLEIALVYGDAPNPIPSTYPVGAP